MEIDIYESMILFCDFFVIHVHVLILRSSWVYSTVMKVVLDVLCFNKNIEL